MTPRIAFLDVDGTILDHGRIVQDSTIRAIRGARAAGHLVFLSTGRSAGSIPASVTGIGFDGAVTNGGAYATVGDRYVVADPMPRAAVEELVAWYQGHGIPFLLQGDDTVHAARAVTAMLGELFVRARPVHVDADDPQTAPQDLAHEAPRIADLDEADLDAIAKSVFLSDRPDAVELARRELGDRFHIVPGSMPLPPGTNGEIGMAGTTKGSAILRVLSHLGLDPASAIGIGDSWNDVEMFEVCGVGIAMGNGEEDLRRLADETTTSVREDGVWNAFVRHGLVEA